MTGSENVPPTPASLWLTSDDDFDCIRALFSAIEPERRDDLFPGEEEGWEGGWEGEGEREWEWEELALRCFLDDWLGLWEDDVRREGDSDDLPNLPDLPDLLDLLDLPDLLDLLDFLELELPDFLEPELFEFVSVERVEDFRWGVVRAGEARGEGTKP